MSHQVCCLCDGKNKKRRSRRDTSVVWGVEFGQTVAEVGEAAAVIRFIFSKNREDLSWPRMPFVLCLKCSKQYAQKRRTWNAAKRSHDEYHNLSTSTPKPRTPRKSSSKTPKQQQGRVTPIGTNANPRTSTSSGFSPKIMGVCSLASSTSLVNGFEQGLKGRALTILQQTLDEREAAAGVGMRPPHLGSPVVAGKRTYGKRKHSLSPPPSPGPPLLHPEVSFNRTGGFNANATQPIKLYSGTYKSGRINKLVERTFNGFEREIEASGDEAEDAANTSILRSGRSYSKVVSPFKVPAPPRKPRRKTDPNQTGLTGVPLTDESDRSDDDGMFDTTLSGAGPVKIKRKRRSSVDVNVNEAFDTSVVSRSGRVVNTRNPGYYKAQAPAKKYDQPLGIDMSVFGTKPSKKAVAVATGGNQVEVQMNGNGKQQGQENSSPVVGSSSSNVWRGRGNVGVGLSGADNQINITSPTGGEDVTIIEAPGATGVTAATISSHTFGFMPPSQVVATCELCKVSFPDFKAKQNHVLSCKAKAWSKDSENMEKKIERASVIVKSETPIPVKNIQITFPFKCDRCEKSYEKEFQLKEHQQQFYNIDGTWIPCDKCTERSFFCKDKVSLGEHASRMHTKKFPFDD